MTSISSYTAALLLGFLQGITEFLPISSSGHLIVAEEFMGLNPSAWLSFDVALHVATACVVLFYFRKEWQEMIKAFFQRSSDNSRRLLLLNIIIGTIPAGIAGILAEKIISEHVRNIQIVAIGLILGSGIMWGAEKLYSMRKKEGSAIEKPFSPFESFLIGCFQALALFPGLSRSGATISGGLILGHDRYHATKYSFLLATPIIIGASLKTFSDNLTHIGSQDIPIFFIGFVTAFITGYASLHYLIRLMKTNTLRPFIIYRLCLAVILFAVVLF
ncbi:MAG: undecaprenyl-diphosphatase UppP [Patescibacteria group bacterium]